jgi:hypothetical protein
MGEQREATSPLIADDIEPVLRSNRNANDEQLARWIADELAARYVMIRRPGAPKAYDGTPRGGRVW